MENQPEQPIGSSPSYLRLGSYAGFALTWQFWQALPWARIAHAVRTILLAKATAATLAGRRATIAFCHAVGSFVWYSTDRAPWINNVRKYGSPRFEIDPNRILPPVPLAVAPIPETKPARVPTWMPWRLRRDAKERIKI